MHPSKRRRIRQGLLRAIKARRPTIKWSRHPHIGFQGRVTVPTKYGPVTIVGNLWKPGKFTPSVTDTWTVVVTEVPGSRASEKNLGEDFRSAAEAKRAAEQEMERRIDRYLRSFERASGRPARF